MKDGSCKKMNPTERILDVLEYLSTAGLGPVKQVDMVRDLGLSPATLNRIVRILSERGYVFRTSEKYLVRNFTIEALTSDGGLQVAEKVAGLHLSSNPDLCHKEATAAGGKFEKELQSTCIQA